ncbi:MAG TPA: PAS domain S-box protein, partial [Methanoculleus sp.]|nr:PAS domain S-box protein [Methanoculleus sp.]
RFRAVVENSLDAVYRRNLQTDRYDYMSPVIEQITGFTPDEMNKMSIDEVLDRIHPDDRRPVDAEIAHAVASGRGIVEYRFRAKDGQYRWLADHFTVLRDRDGQPLYRGGVIRDVTERKQVEEELQSIARFPAENPNSTLRLDKGRSIIYANSAARAMLGDAFGGLGTDAPEDLAAIGETVLASGVRHEGELRIGEKTYLLTSVPFKDYRYVNVYSRDITERKRAEEALRKSEEKYRRFFEQDLTGDIVSAADGQIISCNPAFLEIFGFNSIDEALNTSIVETYPSREDWQQFLELINKEGKVYNFSRIRKRRDGSLIPVVENAAGRFDEDGELIDILGFLYDDSERKQAEDALKDASRKLNLLTSITRHDILNQVTALKAFLILLEEGHHGEGQETEMFNNVKKITDTIRSQITFTGDYQEMGERKPEWQQVEGVITRAAGSVRMNGVALAVETGPLELFADPMLEKVFYNLLDNAVFHGERVEHITVLFREDGDAGVLVVEDDGVGVPASMKTRIFERGFGKVTGYGLFLVKEILDITGISIRETGEEGNGARFEIEVPPGKWRLCESESAGHEWM